MGRGITVAERWRYTRDTDTRGWHGYRIDSETVSLIAWLPDGDGALDQEQAAKHICDLHNATVTP